MIFWRMGVLLLPMQLACLYGLCPSQVTEGQCQDLLFSNAGEAGWHCERVEECAKIAALRRQLESRPVMATRVVLSSGTPFDADHLIFSYVQPKQAGIARSV